MPVNDLPFTVEVPDPQPTVQPLPVVNPLQLQSDPSFNYGFQSSPPIEDGAHITIPAGHHTTTSSLLSLQPIRRLVGYYPQSLFYDLETLGAFPDDIVVSQNLALLLSELALDRETTARLISNFFSFIHPKFPIVDRELFPEVFDKAIEDISRSVYEPSLAVCLLVLALGALGSTEDVFSPEKDDDAGSQYFGVAYRILMTRWAGSFGSSLSQPTGMLLAAVYLCFKSRPLAAWKLAYMTSSSLQLLTQWYEIRGIH